MKKIAFIMLAVVSMALVSCGGGNNGEKKGANKIVPATPAITYDSYMASDRIPSDEFKGCFEVKSVGVREKSTFELTASATLEVIKELPEAMKSGAGDLALFDENMVQIGENDFYGGYFEHVEKGDVFTISQTITTDQMAGSLLNEIKYVQIKGLHLWKKE